MAKETEYRLFRNDDAGAVANLLNRNRFYAGRHKVVSAEDFLEIQRCRGTLFLVVAIKEDEVIGIAGAYHTGNQQVANMHQIYLGTYLIDNRHRNSYAVIIGMFEVMMIQLQKSDYKELLAIVLPHNTQSYFLLLKYGFFLDDGAPNVFGRWTLRNMSAALGKFADMSDAGDESGATSHDEFFFRLPIVDKKEARKGQGKQRLYEKYVECGYMYGKTKVLLLIDTVNYKVDGLHAPKQVKVLPAFSEIGKYTVENLLKSMPLTITVHKPETVESGRDDISYDITIQPEQTVVVECPKEMDVLKLKIEGNWYCFYPYELIDMPALKAPLNMECGRFSVSFDQNTGFMSISQARDDAILAKLIWPCATIPYVEGVVTPRIKELHVQELDGKIVAIEETEQYSLTRTFQINDGKLNVVTMLTCSDKCQEVRPISQIYAEPGIMGCKLNFLGEEVVFGASDIKHEGYEFNDYSFWDASPERYAGLTCKSIDLQYPSSTIEIIPDKTSKPVFNVSILTFNLNFNTEKILEEQKIEEIEINFIAGDMR